MSFKNAVQVGNAIGKTKATIGLVIGVILTILLTPVAGWMLLRPRKYNTKSTAKIINIVNDECERYDKTFKRKNGKSTTRTHYKCDVTYEYTAKNKKYTQKAELDRPTNYIVGDPLDVFYNSNDPKDSELTSDDYRVPGAFIGVFLCVLIIGVFTQYYMVSNIKGYGSYSLAMNIMQPRARF